MYIYIYIFFLINKYFIYRRIKKLIWDQQTILLKASKACCKRSGGCKCSEMQHFWPFASSKYRKNTAFMRELLKIAAFMSFQRGCRYIAVVLRFQRLEILYIAAFLSFQRLQIL